MFGQESSPSTLPAFAHCHAAYATGCQGKICAACHQFWHQVKQYGVCAEAGLTNATITRKYSYSKAVSRQHTLRDYDAYALDTDHASLADHQGQVIAFEEVSITAGILQADTVLRSLDLSPNVCLIQLLLLAGARQIFSSACQFPTLTCFLCLVLHAASGVQSRA